MGKFHGVIFHSRTHGLLTFISTSYRISFLNGQTWKCFSFACSISAAKAKPSALRMISLLPEYKCSHFHRNLKFSENYYQEAIQALNNLQSNESVLQKLRKENQTSKSNNIPTMQKYLDRVKIIQEDLDSLSVIHVAGTKGKGSTCAFAERILMEHGYKTGFYSSPHLVVARERIRINGLPISKEGFTHYFWEVFNELQALKSDPTDMPAYFKFLTILAFKIFCTEKVDVAIMEVGIGGENDCTNVVRHPSVCGITALDIDHISVLGKSIESIAWHKAGIMKSGVPTFTVAQEFSSSMPVLFKRAEERNSPLRIVPPLDKYECGNHELELGLSGDVQASNASLALQLSHCWLRKKTNGVSSHLDENHYCQAFALGEKDLTALKSVIWPGRSQILTDGPTTYFLDGAHTQSSMRGCITWYKSVSPSYCSAKPGDTFKILLFNVTGDRDPEVLLRVLYPLDFDFAIFTTNLATSDVNAASDQKNFTVSEASQLRRCQRIKSIWDDLCTDTLPAGELFNGDASSSSHNRSEEGNRSSRVFPCINDAVKWFTCTSSHHSDLLQQPQDLLKASHIQVLVTGSLHLIGGFISIVDPTLSSLSQNSQNVCLSRKLDSEEELSAL